MDKLPSRLRFESHFILVLGSFTKTFHNGLYLVQILRRIAKLDIAPNLGQCPFENHLISWHVIIVILENVVLIDKSNLHGEMTEDKIGLVDWEIAIAKNLLAMAAQQSTASFSLGVKVMVNWPSGISMTYWTCPSAMSSWTDSSVLFSSTKLWPSGTHFSDGRMMA